MITKHVGKHNNRKIVILYRKVPNENHMCLVTYTEVLPRQIHDDLIGAVESAMGQQAKELADYLFRALGNNGDSILTTLHKEGFIKKVPTNQVIVTPNSTSNVRLDELNEILDKMAMGEEAVKELANLDSSQGMTGKKRKADVEELRTPANSRSQPAKVQNTASLNEVLGDEDLAAQRLAQAIKMEQEAQQLLAEAKRLKAEADTLNGTPAKNAKRTTKKTTKIKEA